MFSKVFYGWWVVLACFVISLYVGGVIFFGFTAFFHPIREELGWSYTQISLASSLRGMEMGFFAPVVGFVVSRYGPRKLLLAGMFTTGVGLVLLSRVNSLLGFYGTFLLIAFGAGGCTSVVTMTAVANWFHKNVGIALGIMASGFGASGLIVPIIVNLIGTWGWRPTLVILGAGAWVIGIPLSLIIRDRPANQERRPEGETGDNPNVTAKRPDAGFNEAIRSPSFLYLNLGEAIRMLSVTAVVVHVMPYLQNNGTERGIAGMIAASLPLVSIAGRFGFGWLSDHYAKRYVLAVTFVIMSGGLLAFCFVENAGMLLLFVLLFSPGFGGSMVLRGAILRDYFGRESFGKLLGVIMGAGSVGGIIGPTLAGWSFDDLGSYKPMWVILSCLTAVSAVLVLRIRPLKR
ncbi:MAG: MFS transporter [Desulfobacteraceae bacterium]|nr:MAG: MFS transporter [Desulfobacteraceae bacterium]